MSVEALILERFPDRFSPEQRAARLALSRAVNAGENLEEALDRIATTIALLLDNPVEWIANGVLAEDLKTAGEKSIALGKQLLHASSELLSIRSEWFLFERGGNDGIRRQDRRANQTETLSSDPTLELDRPDGRVPHPAPPLLPQ